MISGFERGGGVFIAVKRSIHSELVIINDNTLEQVFIKIKDSLSYIRDKLPDASLLIIGDYNLPSSISRTECTKIIYENLSMLGCQQFNNVLNIDHKTLDLCFSNAGIVLCKTPAIIEEDKLHPAIDITLEFNTHLRPEVSSSYVFKKADYDSLNNFFIRTNWIDLYKIDYIDDKLNWFYQKVYEGVDKFVPLHAKKPSNYPCWFTLELIRKIKLKNKAHAIYKQRSTRLNYNRFTSLRHECKALSARCYRNYVIQVEDSIKTDTQAFWKFIKNKKKYNTEIPAKVHWNNSTANTGEDISNLFASFFEGTYTSSDAEYTQDSEAVHVAPTNHDGNFGTNCNLSDMDATFDVVFKQLTLLDTNKGAGPDGLPNIFLRGCAMRRFSLTIKSKSDSPPVLVSELPQTECRKLASEPMMSPAPFRDASAKALLSNAGSGSTSSS
ncbi:uncharacterized protein LOC126765855 [Bactrocera neohumeralis]|uniref:uncharacterized protein LOC126765855 n=1 Tax=Bactrocera neohumeralis TaxID=98809 RepID=UPI0021665C01|nr:uncharacterized protein LOC126765855 [Bactrocera neohumeralis]